MNRRLALGSLRLDSRIGICASWLFIRGTINHQVVAFAANAFFFFRALLQPEVEARNTAKRHDPKPVSPTPLRRHFGTNGPARPALLFVFHQGNLHGRLVTIAAIRALTCCACPPSAATGAPTRRPPPAGERFAMAPVSSAPCGFHQWSRCPRRPRQQPLLPCTISLPTLRTRKKRKKQTKGGQPSTRAPSMATVDAQKTSPTLPIALRTPTS